MLDEIITNLTGGFTKMITNLTGGITQGVSSLFVGAEGKLTPFAQIALIFGGVSLAMGLCYWCVNFIRSKIG